MNIADVIKYEGDNKIFVWKHPNEDFNTLTQLIVHESQEALFMWNGQVLDSFGPGRHTLETQNIPLINKVFNRTTGDVSPFHCEVYFVNKVEQMSILWGTTSKIEFKEPTYGIPIYIGASGEMSLKVEDSKKLLIKLVGTETELTQESLVEYFRSILLTRVKAYIAQAIKNQHISIFEIDERLDEFSDGIKELLRVDFIDYGVSLERFQVTTILKPEDDENYIRFKDLYFRQYADIAEAKIKQQVEIIDSETKAKRMVIESEALAKKREQEHYSYQEERGFDVAEGVAENEAIGQFTNMGVGLGTMAGIGGTVGGVMGKAIGGAFKDEETQGRFKCANCGNLIDVNFAFCPFCGKKRGD